MNIKHILIFKGDIIGSLFVDSNTASSFAKCWFRSAFPIYHELILNVMNWIFFFVLKEKHNFISLNIFINKQKLVFSLILL